MESAGKLVMSGRGGCLMLQRHPILENERTAQAGVPQCVQHEILHRSDTDVGEEAVLRVGTCTQYPYHSLSENAHAARPQGQAPQAPPECPDRGTSGAPWDAPVLTHTH